MNRLSVYVQPKASLRNNGDGDEHGKPYGPRDCEFQILYQTIFEPSVTHSLLSVLETRIHGVPPPK